MGMGVLDAGAHRVFMIVLVVIVVHVFMLVLQGIVRMLVRVLFCEMNPDAEPHEGTRRQQRYGYRFPASYGNHRPEEGRNREIRGGAGGTQVTQGHDEKTQTHSIGNEADDHGDA